MYIFIRGSISVKILPKHKIDSIIPPIEPKIGIWEKFQRWFEKFISEPSITP